MRPDVDHHSKVTALATFVSCGLVLLATTVLLFLVASVLFAAL